MSKASGNRIGGRFEVVVVVKTAVSGLDLEARVQTNRSLALASTDVLVKRPPSRPPPTTSSPEQPIIQVMRVKAEAKVRVVLLIVREYNSEVL